MSKYYVLLVSGLSTVVFFAFAEPAYAAVSHFYLYEEVVTTVIDDETGEEYEVYDTITTTIEDGGTYPVDLNQLYQLGLESDAEVDRIPPPQHIVVFRGELFRIDPDSGEREHKANVSGPNADYELSWNQAGAYELDIYAFDEPVPILSETRWFRRLFALLVPRAYAQVPDTYVETLRFTITDENALPECCSNVLFLPGIKGSILVKDDLIGDDVLWPPTIWSDDIAQLAITENGESVNSIFVDGVLEEFSIGPFQVPIYAPFIDFLQNVKDEGIISEWDTLPYDWRFSPERVLEDGIKTRDTVIDVIEKIETLADDSDTGKVTIIAHSMGGLMGKAIIKKLEEEGKGDLIDAFVMVGSPQLGTPQAVVSILHGDGESIGLGFFAQPRIAREIAQNMQMPHDLLPSPTYFDVVNDPVITFNAEAPFTDSWRQKWGDTINSYSEFVSFLTDEDSLRAKPSLNDVHIPEVLNTNNLERTHHFHGKYDSYSFPEQIRVVQIVGWGIPTAKAVEYKLEHELQSYNVSNTIEGDGTVVYPSAISSDIDETYFFDSEDYRREEEISIEHKDLLSAMPVQSLLNSIIKKLNIGDSTFISVEKPVVNDSNSKLLVSTHSPVILGAYDEEGNFTGIDPDQDLSSDFLFVKEEIPGSFFVAFGESQQIFLPKEGKYTFKYQGTGTGSTTVEIATFVNDTEEVVATYTDIPTTETTSATFEIESEVPTESSIAIDQNADGVTDTEILPDSEEPKELSLEELITLLKTKINESLLQKPIKKQLLALVKVFEKKPEAKSKFLQKLLAKAAFGAIKIETELLKKKKKLSAAEAKELLGILAKIKQKL